MSRNGSNLSQVFVSNTAVADNVAMSAVPSGVVGIFPNGTSAASDGAASDLYVDTPSGGTEQWIKSRVQVVQGRTAGNPLASPIINTRDIVRLDWKEHVLAVKAVTTNVTINAVANSTRYALKLVLKHVGAVSNYGEYVSPSYQINDRINEVRNYEFTTTGVGTATVAEIAAGLTAAISADSNAFVTAANATGAQLQITAKDYGSVFQIIDDGDTALSYASGTLVGSWAGIEGVGTGWQVLNDEKKCQGRYGHLNRLYLPMTAETYANSTYLYHCLDITYRHNWPNSTGIAPAGELNTIRIYLADSSTAMSASDADLNDMFMDATAITDKTILFSA
jgi:hypothetical protein